jgi:hypothetical protein
MGLRPAWIQTSLRIRAKHKASLHERQEKLAKNVLYVETLHVLIKRQLLLTE